MESSSDPLVFIGEYKLIPFEPVIKPKRLRLLNDNQVVSDILRNGINDIVNNSDFINNVSEPSFKTKVYFENSDGSLDKGSSFSKSDSELHQDRVQSHKEEFNCSDSRKDISPLSSESNSFSQSERGVKRKLNSSAEESLSKKSLLQDLKEEYISSELCKIWDDEICTLLEKTMINNNLSPLALKKIIKYFLMDNNIFAMVQNSLYEKQEESYVENEIIISENTENIVVNKKIEDEKATALITLEEKQVFPESQGCNDYNSLPGKMKSLVELCIHVLKENIEIIENLSDVSYEIFKPVLDSCTPEQLFYLENCNPHFLDCSEELWKRHCYNDFPEFNAEEKLRGGETWRKKYWALFREHKYRTTGASIPVTSNLKSDEQKSSQETINSSFENSSDIILATDISKTDSEEENQNSSICSKDLSCSNHGEDSSEIENVADENNKSENSSQYLNSSNCSCDDISSEEKEKLQNMDTNDKDISSPVNASVTEIHVKENILSGADEVTDTDFMETAEVKDQQENISNNNDDVCCLCTPEKNSSNYFHNDIFSEEKEEQQNMDTNDKDISSPVNASVTEIHLKENILSGADEVTDTDFTETAEVKDQQENIYNNNDDVCCLCTPGKNSSNYFHNDIFSEEKEEQQNMDTNDKDTSSPVNASVSEIHVKENILSDADEVKDTDFTETAEIKDQQENISNNNDDVCCLCTPEKKEDTSPQNVLNILEKPVPSELFSPNSEAHQRKLDDQNCEISNEHDYFSPTKASEKLHIKSQGKWTREQDKMLLLMCQKNGSSSKTFEAVANALGTKSKKEVKARYCSLISLLRKVKDKIIT